MDGHRRNQSSMNVLRRFRNQGEPAAVSRCRIACEWSPAPDPGRYRAAVTVLRTEQLTLRELTLDDVDGLLEIFADPEAMWAYPSTKDRDQTEGWIRWAIGSYRANGWGLWAVVRSEDGRFLGDCGPMPQPVEGEQVPELGYHIVRAEWGRGYATEAALACRDWFFANTENDRLVSIVRPPNAASRRVAERVHARMRLFVWEKTGTQECLYETLRSDLPDARLDTRATIVR
jgi:RimJ/RimL family protein N-acetyltransferase